MTAVLMSANGPAEVINARRTESLDAHSILKLVGPATEPQFGLVNVVNLIEKAVLAVTLNNDKEQILAHSAFFDYPNVPDVDPAKWQEWLNAYFDCQKCTPLNTLFMHYFAAKQEFSHGSAREIIRTVFNAVPDVHFLYLVVPSGIYPEPALADIFKPLDKKFGAKPLESHSVFVCHRHDHCPVLFVRKARVEDHDDLTPIFNRQSDMLKTTYGDFFLAELIESQNVDNHAIIVESEGTAEGFMSISRKVNLNLLSSCFELGPFHGLRKPHPDDVLVPPTPPPQEEQPVVMEDQEGSQIGGDKPISRSSSISNKGDGTVVPTPSTATRPASGSKTTPAASTLPPQSTPAQPPKPGTSASGAESTDVKVHTKLSDAHMASVASLMSDQDDAESIKSTGSKKSTSVHSAQENADVASFRPELSPTPEPTVPTPRFDPVYYGESNCFIVQLFCIDEKYEMRSLDFLPMAFSLFPDKEFCILTMPHMVPEFPLLQSFVRVTPKCPSILPQELYVFNRSGLLQSFQVRPACTSDEQGVEELTQHIDNKDGLMADLRQYNKARRDPDGTPIQAFVATCLDQIVGLAITRQEEDIEYIRSHYNIEDFIYFNHHRRDEHGHLHHLALNPIFQHQTKLLMKEVLRQAHYTCLYYPVYPVYAPQEIRSKHSLVTSLNYMVPVRARRQIEYPVEQLGGNAPSERVLKEQEKYALSHMNRKLTLEPKVTINARIVVVGASDVGVAFLETLTFCPHLRFNNLVLISPNGLPGELAPDPLRANFLSTSRCYSQDRLAQISLRSWINVVAAKMVAINRGSKYVKVAGGAKVPYDHLILCTGQQYQTSCPTGADISELVTNASLPQKPDARYKGRVPKNVFIVNDEYNAACVLKWLNKHFLNIEGKAIVYGRSLDAYSAVQSLLAVGLPGSRITFVQPPLKYSITCFNNPQVEKTVHEAIEAQGVQMYDGYYLAQWNDGKGGDEVYCTSFTSDTKPIKLECSAFFCFNNKAVDSDAFRAINDSCLVFDGKLVIDANFHTNDLSIRGAGPLTKFQRKYHADQWSHANFNSKEVGSALASTMLRLFDPTLETDVTPPVESVPLIPIYTEAKVQGACLPGGLNYLHFGKPSLDTPLEADMAQLDYGRVLATGDKEGSTQDYFRLHINQYNKIQTVTCLAQKSIDASNLLCLYDLHERFLNNLVSRFDEGLIPDLYSFFRETWCLAIFHDRFPDFRQEIRELLVQRPAVDVTALEEKVRQLIDQDLELEKRERKYLEEQFETSGNKRSLETRLLSFLSYNYYHLPMYAKPGMV
ncbi:cilia- and flagella-associated protein 61-like [Patiria miniata]|uniref:Cilia- and flagella-associated protein 61 N-terminal domain-containing protein n=1 Tax=Patiria miniata TaxID=46514 RepID=A0A914B836_PATMI|nr:cilia- and flagella-associated protein 61-like [Patiria miniata]